MSIQLAQRHCCLNSGSLKEKPENTNAIARLWHWKSTC